MFSNNFKVAFFAILLVLFGVLAYLDPMNWWGTYDVDTNMVATVITRKTDAITELPAGTQYTVANGSTLSWEARKIGGFHTGTVNVSNGIVVVADGEVVGAEFDIDFNTIVVSDIPAEDEQNAKLVGELEDFFNVTTYPTGTFFLTSYTGGIAQGDLTLNGVTKSIEFPAAIVVDGQTATIAADFYIQRSQWNLTKWEGMVQEELKISFDLTATTDEVVVTNTIIESDTGAVATGEVMSGDVVEATTDDVMMMSGSDVTSTGSTEEDIIEAMSN